MFIHELANPINLKPPTLGNGEGKNRAVWNTRWCDWEDVQFPGLEGARACAKNHLWSKKV